jgi:hypothetical protein
LPDNYTNIIYRGKPASDSARYSAIGNSFAVPVIKWIGERIQAVDDLLVPMSALVSIFAVKFFLRFTDFSVDFSSKLF